MKMLKRSILALACCLALNCQTSQADGGRLWIYPYDWGTYWDERPEYKNGPNPTDSEVDYSKVEPPLPTVGEKDSPESEAERALTERMQRDLLRQAWRETLRELVASHRKVALTPEALPTPEAPDSKEIIALGEQGKVLGDNNAFIDRVTDGVAQFGYVNVPEQQAIIAWNGHMDGNGRETLVLTTNEESATGKRGVVLNILPLPGKPIRIAPAGNGAAFGETKSLFLGKMPEGLKPSMTDIGVCMERRIGSHNIFVLAFDDVETFQRDVQAWIAKRFDNKAAALFSEDSVRVLQYYIERGFRYFAFDLTEVGPLASKYPIAYTFVSTHVYYPLLISRIGGSNVFSKVDLVIMSPGELKCNGAITKLIPSGKPAYEENEGTLNMGGHVGFTIDEVRKLDPSLDVFDSGTESVRVRNVIFEKRHNSYKNDFTAVANGQ